MFSAKFIQPWKREFRRQVVTNQKIAIIGFMGTGKTTVAHELALRLNFPAVDLDAMVTSSEGRSPKEIIEEDGENTFREIETRTLLEVLMEGRARIIAVGGGAWTIAQNRKLMAEHETFTVWLDAPFELCWKRIAAGPELRPLARSREMAERLYSERRPIYELADVRVEVSDNESAEEIAAKVANIILQQNLDS
jgi:shikimate kinase